MGTAGYEGLKLDFDPTVNGGFNPGETIGFAIDMDPNSIRGTNKTSLDAGTSPTWDVGGVSGAELIGSTFTVTYSDGTTSTGQLQGAKNQGGSRGLASQNSPNLPVSLTVNGLGGGGVGTYSASGPSVIVNGPAGKTARVVLTKGFIQPVNPYAQFLTDQLAALAATNFPANNAVEFQTVDVPLTGGDQDISSKFDFSGVANYDFAGEKQLPLGFVASVIDPANNNLPIGPVTKPIYLKYADQPNQTRKFEAEAVPASSIVNYRKENIGVASGGQVLSFVGGASNETGSATFKLPSDILTGTYKVIVGTFDENDGVASFDLRLNNNAAVIGSVLLDANLGSDIANASTKAERTFLKDPLTDPVPTVISLKPGDSLKVTGFENSTEHARLDYIGLVPFI